MNEEELLKKLREAFQVEAAERLQKLSDAILRLEQEADPEQAAAILDGAFREAHSLKGAARSINLSEIEALFQSVESVFAAVKRGDLGFSRQLFDLLHEALASTESYLGDTRDNDWGNDSWAAFSPLCERLNQAAEAGSATAGTEYSFAWNAPNGETERQEQRGRGPGSESVRPAAAADKPGGGEEALPGRDSCAEITAVVAPRITKGQRTAASESVRISSSRLDRLLLKAEELLSLKLNAARQVKDLKDLRATIDKQGRAQDYAPATDAGEARRWGIGCADEVKKQLQQLIGRAEQDSRLLKMLIDDLVADMKEILLLPCATVLNIFPRMVRDIAREAGKEAVLEITGSEIEIDKRILEEIKDPLIHLLRNAVDHGIEDPGQRQGKGKPPQGTIELVVSTIEGNRVEILLRDDGGGIAVDRVKDRAVHLGLVSEGVVQRLDDDEALRLVFLSGVSTSPGVTEISGRGLGLAIVSDAVEGLGGRLSMESEVGQGTQFKIVLPVTLATFRGVLVTVGGRPFILPCAHVQRTVRVAWDQVRTVENRPTISLQGRPLPLLDLAAVLGLPVMAGNEAGRPALIVAAVLEAGGERMAFQVDEVLGEDEVLVKGLGPQLKRVQNIAGAAVLATGQVAPVLNVRDLFQSAVVGKAQRFAVHGEGEQQVKQKAILVAEDSITSRVLFKNILEGAGYQVKTAVDGMEAYALLKTGAFDLLVSDVEMPRLDGFELTGRVRADKDLAELPVVLVTGLETPEHRERGIMVGASAYLNKSGFDQTNLIEVVRRLI